MAVSKHLTDQDLRNMMLKQLLEYRKLVQWETLADNMTHDSKELKNLSDACSTKLADICQVFDEIIGGFRGSGMVGEFSPGVARAIKQWEARQNGK